MGSLPTIPDLFEARVRSNGLYFVAPYWNGIASVPGVPGGLYDRMACSLVELIGAVRVSVKVGHTGTGYFQQ